MRHQHESKSVKERQLSELSKIYPSGNKGVKEILRISQHLGYENTKQYICSNSTKNMNLLVGMQEKRLKNGVTGYLQSTDPQWE